MKYLRLVLLLVFVVGVYISCKQDTSKDSMICLVKKWERKQILYPLESTFTIYGKDTLKNYEKSGIKFSIVNYIDSLGCFSCKLQAKAWKDFINTVDSVSNTAIPVNIFIHNRDVIELLSVLEKEKLDIPICIDLNDSLCLLNEFPANLMFRTFLLDNENRVLAIGNPIHNPKVKELYLKIIQGEKIERRDESKVIKTEVDASNISVSLDSFDWQEEQKAIFVLKNVGDKPLVIQDVATSCGCTTVAYSKEPALPGKEIDLEVVYKAEHPEHFDKTITVYCNAETSPLVLKISGDAK